MRPLCTLRPAFKEEKESDTCVSPLRRRLAAVLLLPAAALGLAACGGGDEEDVQELLDRAFQRPLDSMDIELDAEISVEGLEGFDKPIRIQRDGPLPHRTRASCRASTSTST